MFQRLFQILWGLNFMLALHQDLKINIDVCGWWVPICFDGGGFAEKRHDKYNKNKAKQGPSNENKECESNLEFIGRN